MATTEHISFCRICMGSCGTIVTLDENRRMVSIRADREDPQTLGFACFKGLRAVEAHNNPERILHPLKKMPDGSFARIGIEQALDEIAEKLKTIVAESGPLSVAGYKGGGAFFTASAVMMLNDWLRALGSPKCYSSVTIDQSAKMVAAGRLGIWQAGKIPAHRADLMMLVGTNPMVSVNPPFDTRNPVKRMKAARERGMKLIVIDPRHTETASFADLVIQPLPGEDPTLIAGILHVVLAENWHDADFCAANVADLEELRAALAPFDPAYVSARADVPEAQIRAAARMFAVESRSGITGSSTGPDMGPHSNLAEHLLETLNIVCGRMQRAGDRVDNPGMVLPRYPRRAQAMPAPRWWEDGPKSRIHGYGAMNDEMMTGVMADEILEPGADRVRALIVHGGNPASSVPDQRHVVDALRKLDLLVCIEPTMGATARLADYVLPPFMQYERPDLPIWPYEYMLYPDQPYIRYTPAVAAPPEGAELVEDAYVFWGLAKRLGLPLTYLGELLDLTRAPSTDELLAIVTRNVPGGFDALRAEERGLVDESAEQYVEPAEEGWEGRFTLMPDDVRAEIGTVAAEDWQALDRSHRLAVRRLREVFNSVGRDLPTTRKRVPYNLAFVNPDDMAAIGAVDGDEVEVESDRGAIMAVIEADPTLRRRVVSIAHGFGGLPDEASNEGYYQQGVSTNLLLDASRREAINAMPHMTGIPISLRKVRQVQRVSA
ncbi:dehydrogenase [Sphingomonas sp. DBB INV C78]|uniref:molybdopterin-containing oxidoreductase family protein n=1 Tax=Sphingomonas sp. DBB INV C78 TaxID=3349434 RepID=UPI0036D2A172